MYGYRDVRTSPFVLYATFSETPRALSPHDAFGFGAVVAAATDAVRLTVAAEDLSIWQRRRGRGCRERGQQIGGGGGGMTSACYSQE